MINHYRIFSGVQHLHTSPQRCLSGKILAILRLKVCLH